METRPILWMDGSTEDTLPGKLLSDNLEFFGETVPTGADYRYLTPLLSLTDSEQDLAELRGRRLQDGRLIRRFCKEPAVAEGELSMEWDFKRVCVFNEIDLYCGDCAPSAVTVQSADGDPTVWADGGVTARDGLVRVRVNGQSARRLRITLRAAGRIELFQLWAFGDAETETRSDDFSVDTFAFANSIAMESLMGAPHTAFSDVEGFHWMKRMKKAGLFENGAVWSEQPAYGDLVLAPILPSVREATAPVSRRLCRGGSEVVCLALTNTDSTAPRTVRVELDNASPLQAEWMVLGVMQSRWYGEAAGPLLNAEHTIGKSNLYRYVANAPVFAALPEICLPAGGSCLFWIRLTCGENAASGRYTLAMRAGTAVKTITAEVLPLTLPQVHTGIMLWGDFTSMYPFSYADRARREVAYRRTLGVNIYDGWPEPGTPARVAFEEDPTSQFGIFALGDYAHRIYNNQIRPEDVTAEVEEDVRLLLSGCVRKAEEIGIGFDRWFLEMPDEPGSHNMAAVRTFVELCKRIEPRIRIYVNPACWTGFENDGVESDETLVKLLDGWYDTQVDISVPLALNLEDRPNAMRYFRTKREFNGQYWVAGQHMNADRGALVSLPRACAWDSISRDLNFWGFYSYYCPRLNSWDNAVRPYENVDGTINYQCVYGGVNGPIPTRASEAIREGHQDYRIMQLLREKAPGAYRTLQQQYLSGDYTFEGLREAALEALLQD